MAARRVGTIEARGRNRWLVRVYLGLFANGKRNYSSEMVDGTKHDAEKALAEPARQHGRASVERSASTLNEWLDTWLATDVRRNVRETTREQYEQSLRLYVRPTLGALKLQTLKRSHVKALIGELSDRGLAAPTIRNARAALVRALTDAVEADIIPENPAEGLRLPRNAKPAREGKSLTTAQARALLDATRDDPYAAYIACALGLGMRPCELRALRWQDFADDYSTVCVPHSLHRMKGGGWQFFPPKPRTAGAASSSRRSWLDR